MMGSAGFVARSQLRRRWRSVVLLTLLVGVVGGASISLIAGARRSASVVDRYFAASRPYDLVLFAPSLSADAVRSIPGVERADVDAYVAGVHRAPDGTPTGVNALALDPSSFDRTFQVLEGALPTRRTRPRSW